MRRCGAPARRFALDAKRCSIAAVLTVLGATGVPAAAAQGAATAGEAVYARACAHCHEGGVARAPHSMFLRMMAPEAIVRALEEGLMRAQAADLSARERILVAEYLSGQTLAETAGAARAPRCDESAPGARDFAGPAIARWGVTPANTRAIPAAIAGLTAAELPRLELQWVFAFPGAQRVRSQPAVTGDTVFIGSQDGTVYALERRSGCVRWTFHASAEVRTAIVFEPGARPRVYFADLLARVYALDARDGTLLWSTKVDAHPNATITAAPALHGQRLYVSVSSLEVTSAGDPHYPCCTFRGSVVALQASSGEVIWKTYTIADEPREVGRTAVGTPVLAPSGAPIWNTPTLDPARGVLYVGTGENYSSPANESSDAVLALRLEDGARVWRAQQTAGDAWNVACMMRGNPNCPVENGPDVDFGAAVVLAAPGDGRELLLAGQKSGEVHALDPQRAGRVLWRRRVGRGGIQGGVHFGMALDGNRLFVPISDMRNEFSEGKVYDWPPRPGLYALDVVTGELLWSSPADDVCAGRALCEPGISAAVTVIPGAVLAGHMDGRLRAYDAATGAVIWEYHTAREFEALGGVAARGGSFGGGAGPIVHGGMLFAGSGYGIYNHMPGNVLLAFGLPRH